jgi:hypothetical protein
MVLKEDQRRADSTYWQAHYKLDKWMRKSTGTSGPGEVRTMPCLDGFQRLDGMIGIALGQFP